MKRIFTLLPPWFAALFAAVFLAIMPMAYYLHLSSGHHGHGHFSDAGCCHGACHPDARDMAPAASQGQSRHTHHSSTCLICQGMSKLHQAVGCQISGLFMQPHVVAGPPPASVASPLLAAEIRTHPRAPPAC